jgi:hypothetical protein
MDNMIRKGEEVKEEVKEAVKEAKVEDIPKKKVVRKKKAAEE